MRRGHRTLWPDNKEDSHTYRHALRTRYIAMRVRPQNFDACSCMCVCWTHGWAVQIRPNRSRCRLGGWLKWVHWTMYRRGQVRTNPFAAARGDKRTIRLLSNCFGHLFSFKTMLSSARHPRTDWLTTAQEASHVTTRPSMIERDNALVASGDSGPWRSVYWRFTLRHDTKNAQGRDCVCEVTFFRRERVFRFTRMQPGLK